MPGESYEYQRALKIEPDNAVARKSFADILVQNGFHESYLEQLRFLRDTVPAQENTASRTYADIQRDDIIEGYDSLLEGALARRWNVEPFYFDKVRWNVGLYTVSVPLQLVHADLNEITARMAADLFSGIAVTAVSAETKAVTGFGAAFHAARTAGLDYFVLLSVDEGLRDIQLTATLYAGRTGIEVERMSFYAVGVNRYAQVLRRFRAYLLDQLAVRGKIVGRRGTDVLVDVGRAKLVADGATFAVVRKGGVTVADDGHGVAYREGDVLGTVVIDETGEEISQGTLSPNGFYDRVNVGDEVVLVSMPERERTEELASVVATAPQATATGTALTESRSPVISAADIRPHRVPVYVELIRGIY